MAARDLFERLGDRVPKVPKVPGAWQRSGTSTDHQPKPQDIARIAAPLGGTRTEAVQRLQVGITGVFAMILLVGLADAIGGQASKAEQNAVPDAAPTTEPTALPSQSDPLADAGVVPDIPPDPEDTAPAPPASDAAAQRSVTLPDTPKTRTGTRRNDD